eukprot:351911-Chlamydomonas_euryale.AAC.3
MLRCSSALVSSPGISCTAPIGGAAPLATTPPLATAPLPSSAAAGGGCCCGGGGGIRCGERLLAGTKPVLLSRLESLRTSCRFEFSGAKCSNSCNTSSSSASSAPNAPPSRAVRPFNVPPCRSTLAFTPPPPQPLTPPPQPLTPPPQPPTPLAPPPARPASLTPDRWAAGSVLAQIDRTGVADRATDCALRACGAPAPGATKRDAAKPAAGRHTEGGVAALRCMLRWPPSRTRAAGVHWGAGGVSAEGGKPASIGAPPDGARRSARRCRCRGRSRYRRALQRASAAAPQVWQARWCGPWRLPWRAGPGSPAGVSGIGVQGAVRSLQCGEKLEERVARTRIGMRRIGMRRIGMRRIGMRRTRHEEDRHEEDRHQED